MTLSAPRMNPAINEDCAAVDSYFFDPQLALNAAVRHARIATAHPTIDGLQICYYDGPLVKDAPVNMINVPFEQFSKYFGQTRNRFPKEVVFPDNTPPELVAALGRTFQQALSSIVSDRDQRLRELQAVSAQQRPIFSRDEPLRVLLPSSRLTTVMQHSSKNIAMAFNELGHDAKVIMEAGDMEQLDRLIHLQERYRFNPHVLFYINGYNPLHSHEEVFHFSWWQDMTPALTNGTIKSHRERDYTFSLAPVFDHALNRAGISDPLRQRFCIDSNIFRPLCEIRRENKVVFIGSSYASRLTGSRAEQKAISHLQAMLEHGYPVTDVDIDALSNTTGLGRDTVYWDIYHYVVRDLTVRWLCQASPIPVEIYGRGWETDPVVAPFFKGELPHGEEIAEVYNNAAYTLVSHPFEVNSQRLVEAAACGCVPIVYDCRHVAEPPHWERYCLFFCTRADLGKLLSSSHAINPTPIAQDYTYTALAQRVVDIVHRHLGWN